ncbi:MAG TPA: ABC transporter permease [Candidatus Binataceae bacterium]|nr:ABC transporter permease [Candidatus Binataceae bacterium]HYB92269.1 ABC transporter permease [Candidatus Binataceae bacterium]
MILHEMIADSLAGIRTNWRRVLLTSSGIVWGVALFVALTAAGQAMAKHYRAKMEAVGPKVIYVFAGSVARTGEGARTARTVHLDIKDPPRLPGSPTVERAEPEVQAGLRVVKGGGHIKVAWTYGVGPDTGIIRNFTVARGRFITRSDVAARAQVLVIGAKVEERLFGRRSALGETVRLDGYPFRVIGISALKGEQMVNMGPRDDEQVLMPVSTAQRLFTLNDRIGYLIYEPRTRNEAAQSMTEARLLLGRHHSFTPADDEALAFFNVGEIITAMDSMSLALNVFLAACGLVTLAIGAIGVMNIMLVAVTERTREIGLRKALGATNRLVFLQLMCETLAMTLAAGLIGDLAGGGLIRAMQIMRDSSARAQFLMPEVVFSGRVAILSTLALVAAGTLAALLPAMRAVRVDPAIALREE